MKTKILIICCIFLTASFQGYSQIHIISDKAEIQEAKNGEYKAVYTSYETVHIYIYERTISVAGVNYSILSKELKETKTGRSYIQYETKDSKGDIWSLIVKFHKVVYDNLC